MDDFSWGNTRLVIGEGNNKKVIMNDDEKFDDSMVPLKKFSGTYFMIRSLQQLIHLLQSTKPRHGRQDHATRTKLATTASLAQDPEHHHHTVSSRLHRLVTTTATPT